jgi:hypothetical protein
MSNPTSQVIPITPPDIIHHICSLCSVTPSRVLVLAPNEVVISLMSTDNTYLICINKLAHGLCGLVVRDLDYRPGGPGSIPGTTRKK